ncbi:MAG: formyltetrahydrofolate deformylase [Campylobacterota bacterium]
MQLKVLIDCSDEKGLVYKVSKLFYESGLNIEKNSEFVDSNYKKFFMRSVIEGEIEVCDLEEKLKTILPDDANIKVIQPRRKKILIMATKESHCLGDLLIRYADGELDADIQAVISNYDSLQDLTQKFDIPFHHVSADGITRDAHEANVMEYIDRYAFDYIVLAKYMRILNPAFVKRYDQKIINIHHSFLPAFIGANPYKQAYERGVKIIGATAHFVNNMLDEGPIIYQDITRIDHSYSWQDMKQAGQDVEKIVLAKALKYALEDRIFMYANKTVIF